MHLAPFKKSIQSIKSQTELINIHNFHLISKIFTIYLPFYTARKLALNLCYYQSEYKLTNCTHALQQSKDITCTCIPINKIITALI
jgi:hypothetical protein